MNLWIADRAGHDAIGELPEGVALSLIARDGELADAILDAEFLVPGAGDRRVLELMSRMPRLRVIQTLSAGVDRLLELVPTGVTLATPAGPATSPWPNGCSPRSSPRPRIWERCATASANTAGSGAGRPSWPGSTVMILGYGAIGARGRGATGPVRRGVIRVARRTRRGVHSADELASLLGLADIVVVLLPLTPATTGLLDAVCLRACAPARCS